MKILTSIAMMMEGPMVNIKVPYSGILSKCNTEIRFEKYNHSSFKIWACHGFLPHSSDRRQSNTFLIDLRIQNRKIISFSVANCSIGDRLRSKKAFFLRRVL